jgi:Uma2 family endonuclease
MAVQQTRRLTVEELYEMEDLPERFEVIRGEIVEMAPTGWTHTSTSMRIGIKLGIWLENNPIGVLGGADGGFALSQDPLVVLVPDVSLVLAERLPQEHSASRIPNLAPDLVVEVISPSDRASRVHDKVLTYLELGVRLVWVVDPPRRTVTVYSSKQPKIATQLNMGESLDGGDVLPGFKLPLANIFEQPADSYR